MPYTGGVPEGKPGRMFLVRDLFRGQPELVAAAIAVASLGALAQAQVPKATAAVFSLSLVTFAPYLFTCSAARFAVTQAPLTL